MTLKKTAIYSYKSDPDFVFGSRFKLENIIIITIIIGFILYNISKELIFIPALLFIILLILRYINPNKILVDSLFFIFHKKVFYYSSLKKIEINQSSGFAKISLKNDKQIIIYRNNFPTSAQKEDKIRYNKMRSFSNVIGKIVKKAKIVNPDLICEIKEI